jgi:hypothetical protein
MTVDETLTPTPTIPRPRDGADDAPAPEERSPGKPVGEFPWPEPWHFSRGARQRSEYWDVATASWHSRGPIVYPPD